MLGRSCFSNLTHAASAANALRHRTDAPSRSTPAYPCISRPVRRACLRGHGALSGRNVDHRRARGEPSVFHLAGSAPDGLDSRAVTRTRIREACQRIARGRSGGAMRSALSGQRAPSGSGMRRSMPRGSGCASAACSSVPSNPQRSAGPSAARVGSCVSSTSHRPLRGGGGAVCPTFLVSSLRVAGPDRRARDPGRHGLRRPRSGSRGFLRSPSTATPRRSRAD
jgi:hypothetical protein